MNNIGLDIIIINAGKINNNRNYIILEQSLTNYELKGTLDIYYDIIDPYQTV
jgi:hypothetical protein